MLCEQIEEEKGKITSEGLLSADEEKEFSFSTPVKMRGLEVTDIRILIPAQIPKDALFGRGNDIHMPKGGKGKASYSGSGRCEIEDWEVSRRGAVHFHTKEHIRRWH